MQNKTDVLYRGEQTNLISEKLNLPKSDVDLILKNYTAYLREKLIKGETIKVLNICYIKNPDEPKNVHRETLGFISTELSKQSRVGSITIQRVLTTLEELIIKDISEGKAYSLRGLIRIRCIDTDAGKKVRIKKSTKDNGSPVYIVTLNSFRRKVEKYAG